jgi:hypothetical protein
MSSFISRFSPPSSSTPTFALDPSLFTFALLDSGYSYWKYSPTPTPGRLHVDSLAIDGRAPGGTGGVRGIFSLKHNNPNTYTYSPDKTYQIITNTLNVYGTAASFSVAFNWGDQLNYSRGMTGAYGAPGAATQSFVHYSTPPGTWITRNDVIYRANGTFSAAGSRGIVSYTINELDFKILGFSYYKMQYFELSREDLKNSLGWYYDKPSDIYFWYDRVSSTSSNDSLGYFPVGGNNNSKVANKGYRLNNAIYKFVPYTYFNLNFNYQNTTSSPLRIYLSPSPPSTLIPSTTNYNNGIYTPPSGSILIATITQSFSGTYSSTNSSVPVGFYGIRGNQYLIFVGPFMGATSSSSATASVYLQNILVDGAYHSGNNRQYVMTSGSDYSTTVTGLTGATYATIVGNGNTINATSSLSIGRIYSKIGNGSFKAGIWENGVWNSGWRVDDGMFEFYNVSSFFSYNRNKRWRIQISGPSESVSNFNIGDSVAIGNIVAIDINEDRKLLKGYYTIINKTSNSIIVEFDNNFPIRRIEKDSDNHRIFITKNVWLSGAFLNGYFKGVWNYGLFKGYPLITEMYDSHWIDGIFDGGHFVSNPYILPDFVDTFFNSNGVGLQFSTSSTPHGLVVGDLITVDKNNKSLNPQYDGEHNVLEVVDNYKVIIDVDFGADSTLEGGKVYIDKNKGLLQRVDFKSNNISKITSANSTDSGSVFVYNSWMDVNYDPSYATNIGKPQSTLNSLSRRSFSENNLYGYTTNDVLESNSTFRDSFSTTIRRYRLGTKYKIFADFIGDAGKFEDEFGGTFSDAESTFIKEGWTFSRTNISSLTFSRTTPADNEPLITGEELIVQARNSGGILDITPFSDEYIANRTYEEVQKLRYTKVEFDLITFSGPITTYGSNYNYLFTFNNFYLQPPIHFNNLNLVIRQTYTSGIRIRTIDYAKFLPIYENVNHLNTRNKRKVEYFYNKRGLSMNFTGLNYPLNGDTSASEYIIDNLHFYEIDMIPFFQYFTDNNINRSVQIPFQGISPFIDYSNVGFNFVDNLTIGLDSIRTENSNGIISGVGAGIGTIGSVTSGSIGFGSIFVSPASEGPATSLLLGPGGGPSLPPPYTISGGTSTTFATITGTITVNTTPVTITLTSSTNPGFTSATEYTTAALTIGGTGTITGGGRTMIHNSSTLPTFGATTRTLTQATTYPYTLSITTTSTGLASFSLS